VFVVRVVVCVLYGEVEKAYGPIKIGLCSH
jgi:hypothetical protein